MIELEKIKEALESIEISEDLAKTLTASFDQGNTATAVHVHGYETPVGMFVPLPAYKLLMFAAKIVEDHGMIARTFGCVGEANNIDEEDLTLDEFLAETR